MNNKEHVKFLHYAIDLALNNVINGAGGPFGAVIVRDGEIVATGVNQVTATNDPTAHAEIVAIRNACKTLNSFQLTDCILYTSCEPCPMCFGAIYWARPSAIFYGATKDDAAAINFDDSFIYEQLTLPHELRTIPLHQLLHTESLEPFKKWQQKTDLIRY